MGEMILNSVIDHIPLWGWFVIIGVPIGALLYFFSPILLPIWHMLPTPVKAALIFVGAVFLAFMGGRYRGRSNAEEEERRRNAEALGKRTEVDRHVDSLDKKGLDGELDRWRRD